MAGASATSLTRTVRVAGTSEAATSSSRAAPSPSSASTLGKILGRDWRRRASASRTCVSAPVQPLRGRRIGSGEGDPQVADADQPLLGAVVQVALDAPAFGIRGRDHPVGRLGPRPAGRWRRRAGRCAAPAQSLGSAGEDLALVGRLASRRRSTGRWHRTGPGSCPVPVGRGRPGRPRRPSARRPATGTGPRG